MTTIDRSANLDESIASARFMVAKWTRGLDIETRLLQERARKVTAADDRVIEAQQFLANLIKARADLDRTPTDLSALNADGSLR